MKTILKVEDLKKSFDKKEVVKGINFQLKENEILGLLGPNGAGKSTTINMITTILDKDGGKVFYKDSEIDMNINEYKKNLGLVPQDIAVFNDLSAYNNVKFFGSLYGLKGSKLKDRCKKALEYVGLWEKKNEYPDTFSGGMKRRLNIACAIVHKPKILIMDEPTVGIDPQSRNNILEVTRSLSEEGTSIIYTSHYMEEVEAVCSRLLIIDRGSIVEQGNKEDIKEKYKSNSLEEIFLNITGKELRD